MATVKNPQQKTVNQSQGPRTGNAGTAAKRDEFIKMKSTGVKQDMADLVMAKLEARNPGFYYDPKVESLMANSGPKRNPTAGGTQYNVTKRAPKPRPSK